MTLDAQTEKLLERGAVLLEPQGPARLTEFGKRWMDNSLAAAQRFKGVLLDISRLAEWESGKWDVIERTLRAEGVPTALSGVSQYAMAKLIDHLNGKTAYTAPTTPYIGLWTAAPSSTSTGATANEAAYTGYARLSLTAATWSNAATSATPSVATNNGAITFGACTLGTSTLLGFMILDASGASNALWYGSLTSTVISTTQTPPTIATTAMSLSMNSS